MEGGVWVKNFQCSVKAAIFNLISEGKGGEISDNERQKGDRGDRNLLEKLHEVTHLTEDQTS